MKSTRDDLMVKEDDANLRRHIVQCSVCPHPDREGIERDWVAWGNTTVMAHRYGLSRDSIYRHMHATGFFRKRQKNLKAAYESIIERLEIASFSGSSILAALKAYAALCEREESQERSLPAQQPGNERSEQEPEGVSTDCSLPESPTSETTSTSGADLDNKSDQPAPGNRESESVATTIPNQIVEKMLQVSETTNV